MQQMGYLGGLGSHSLLPPPLPGELGKSMHSPELWPWLSSPLFCRSPPCVGMVGHPRSLWSTSWSTPWWEAECGSLPTSAPVGVSQLPAHPGVCQPDPPPGLWHVCLQPPVWLRGEWPALWRGGAGGGTSGGGGACLKWALCLLQRVGDFLSVEQLESGRGKCPFEPLQSSAAVMAGTQSGAWGGAVGRLPALPICSLQGVP